MDKKNSALDKTDLTKEVKDEELDDVAGGWFGDRHDLGMVPCQVCKRRGITSMAKKQQMAGQYTYRCTYENVLYRADWAPWGSA